MNNEKLVAALETLATEKDALEAMLLVDNAWDDRSVADAQYEVELALRTVRNEIDSFCVAQPDKAREWLTKRDIVTSVSGAVLRSLANKLR